MTALEDVLLWAREQIGTAETGENNVKFNTDYYGSPVQGGSYPWCCAFVWDAFYQTGLSRLFCDGAKTAYCPYVMSWAKAHGKWVEGDYRPGDLLLYDWNGDMVADHIGICTMWNSEYAYAIEGNVNDRVMEVTRWPNNILGAYRPDYASADADIRDEEPPGKAEPQKDEEWTSAPLLRRGDVSGAVLSVQVLLIHKWAVSCGPDGADGDFGPRTEDAVKRFQRSRGIEADGIVGPATWRKIIA